MSLRKSAKKALRYGRPSEIKRLYFQYERYVGPGAMLFGFIIDSLTLTRVDLWLDNIILLTYLIIVSGAIMIMNAYDAGRLRSRFSEKLAFWLPLVMQFALGGLFSGFVVLYSRSSSLTASWPFLLVLAGILIGNEFLRDRYNRIMFQLSILYIGIFSYLIFAVPVVINKIGVLVFILSGFLSLLLIRTFVYILTRVTPWKIQFNRKNITTVILSIFVFFNALYFTDIIPPIPLSLKSIGVYHSVENRGQDFVMTYEPEPWYQFYRESDKTYRQVPRTPVYVYSAVFAPADIRSDIVHQWAILNESTDTWKVTDNITYPIVGGRDEGYRGFSVKRNIGPGKWRVHVKNEIGQTLGKIRFDVIPVDQTPELSVRTR